MTELDRFKQYMELCGIYTKKQLITDGNYPKTEQYLGQVLNGVHPFSALEQKRLYEAVNVARAKHLREEAERLESSAKNE
jgi:hypothetical protein